MQSSSVIHHPDRGGGEEVLRCSYSAAVFSDRKALRSVITRVMKALHSILGGASELGVDSRNGEGDKSRMEEPVGNCL